MVLFKRKRASVDLGMENLVYILLVVIFAGFMIWVIQRPASGVSAYEQIYSKQIAMMIDKAEPGMEIQMDLYDIYKFSKRNNFDGNWVSIDNGENKVTVKLTIGEGYSFYYFKDVDVVWNLDKGERRLFMTILEKQEAENE